jgi:hypothetical protein
MAKTYQMSFGAACAHAPEHPERTARRSAGWDVVFQVWTNRTSMARTIRMQEKREYRDTDWRAVVKLSDGEGF